MFRIRVYSPPLMHHEPRAVGELVVGDVRRHFAIDLRFWRATDYERQWKAGLERLLYGASSSALMTSYRGTDDAPHLMWALWREEGFVYVQPHCVLPEELDRAFDPFSAWSHVDTRVPVTEQSLPIAEWRVELAQLAASVMQIRWPPPFGQ
jgi:hypothetical protein